MTSFGIVKNGLCASTVLVGSWLSLLISLFMVPSFSFGAKEAMVMTSSGLQYQDIVLGTGREAQDGQTAIVHYTGKLTNGKKFDSSKDRDRPFPFKLGAGRVIKGWEEGVKGMKIGGTRKLVIPPELGYGSRGAGSVIPPDATLIFEVELLDLRD